VAPFPRAATPPDPNGLSYEAPLMAMAAEQAAGLPEATLNERRVFFTRAISCSSGHHEPTEAPDDGSTPQVIAPLCSSEL